MTAATVPPSGPSRRDVPVAVAVWLLDLALFSTAGTDLAGAGDPGVSTAGLLAFATLGPVALLWRRRSPVAVFAVVWALGLVGTALVPGYQPVLGVLVALYAVGAHAPAARAWVIVPALAPYLVIAANEAWLAGRDDAGRRTAVFIGLTLVYVLIVAGTWALGWWAGSSRRRLATAERLRAVEAQRAVADERARISRELHDIVAHTVTVMLLQAGGARRVLGTDPDRAGQALVHIEQAGRQAVEELRRMLAVIAPGDTTAPDDPRHPGPAEIGELVAGMRAGGLRVSLTVDGEPRPVDPSVGLAAYRTVQEALTNVVRYAGPQAGVTVRLAWADQLEVEVRDTGGDGGVPDGPLSTGRGLAGLRERVAVAGGELTAAPVAGEGFRVRARLPLPPVEAAVAG
ncbi:Signal transduction histidine kinase [Micromonospora phaseoli]|uniref:histidine kinase n=1 Tax=Micromonospora phaseoli TaxID=1144548 RepID=A0A1H6Y599_9ACTN|nr:histidine kinase [Micromonospora phaseoli]PZW00003.1 signal transduction histidine kinase [Micromonospora phaseoli]GIJ80457.1 two-component sensor histidine kinase [Micromonospora phaseoli]SEJ35626.1 Signal transduction histidine kinase [Micromonospora phaseoli]